MTNKTKTVIIIGGGFAGIAAAKHFGNIGSSVQTILIDKEIYTTMLPALPDIAAGNVFPERINETIKKLIPYSVRFIRDEIKSIDFEKKTLVSSSTSYHYDYLLIAGGSAANFYGFKQNLSNVHRLDSLNEALSINKDFFQRINTNEKPLNLIIAGAGYTGLELAFALGKKAVKKKHPINIFIIEASAKMLPFLKDNEMKFIKHKLERKGFKILFNTSINHFDGKNVQLNTGEIIPDAFLCWTAGTQFFLPGLNNAVERIGDGRILVNSYLQLNKFPEVFAAGDSAAIKDTKGYIRKAVNYAIYSGSRAGNNIRRLIWNLPLKPFKPFDPGWIIPLGNASVGKLFGFISIKGNLALRAHYAVVGLRNFNLKNFLFWLFKALTL